MVWNMNTDLSPLSLPPSPAPRKIIVDHLRVHLRYYLVISWWFHSTSLLYWKDLLTVFFFVCRTYRQKNRVSSSRWKNSEAYISNSYHKNDSIGWPWPRGVYCSQGWLVWSRYKSKTFAVVERKLVILVYLSSFFANDRIKIMTKKEWLHVRMLTILLCVSGTDYECNVPEI